MHRFASPYIALALTTLFQSFAQAGVTIHFDSPTYQVQHNGTVQTQIS